MACIFEDKSLPGVYRHSLEKKKKLTSGSVNEQITMANRKSCALSEIYHKVIKNFNANGDGFNFSRKKSLFTSDMETKHEMYIFKLKLIGTYSCKH